MLVTASCNVSRLYALLMAVSFLYKNALQNFSIEMTYGSAKAQLDGYFLTNGPMEVTFDQAEIGCIKARGKLFFATERMDIKSMFEKMELQSTWTMVYRKADGKVFLDESDFVPLTRTKCEVLNSQKLVATSFTDDMAVILNKTDTATGVEFSYEPVLKNTLHRAVCMQPITFPRRLSTMKTLEAFKLRFLAQLEEVEKSVESSSQIANNSMRILPALPPSFDLTNARPVLFEENLTTKIQKLQTEAEKVVNIFKTLEDPADLINLLYQHSFVLNSLQSLEGEIMEPIFRPLAFLDRNWQNELKTGSGIQLFATNEDKLVLFVEDPKVLAIELVTEAGIPTGTVPVLSTTSTTTEPDNFGTDLPTMTTSSTSTTTTTTTTATTTTTSTMPTSTGTGRPSPLDDESWTDWFYDKIQKIKTFSEFLSQSWRFPSIYDIVFFLVSFIHSILFVVLFTCFQRRRTPSTRKLTLRKLFAKPRPSVRKIITKKPLKAKPDPSRPQPSAPAIELMPTPGKTLKKSRVRIQEPITSDEEQEFLYTPPSQPVKAYKRPAPTPPRVLQPNMYSTNTMPYRTVQPKFGTGTGRRTTAYLKTSVPLYLVDSDLSED